MFAIEAQDVCKAYHAGTPREVQALRNVSLGVPAGAFCLLTGPSGSGKTTLLALLGCLDRPTCGEVRLVGQSVSGYSDAELTRLRRRLGFIFQDFALIAGLPIWENVTYHLIPRAVSRRERYRLAQECLARVELLPRANAIPRELSGGELQRAAIARALAGQPEILLADEPTSSLDAEAGAGVIALLADLHASGKTVLVASHDARLASLATTRFALTAFGSGT
jgi:putative ABC transport system ATP-binding protein